jgi:hypothetical protein
MNSMAIDLAVLLANFVDRANVGMIQRRRGARLSPKTFQPLWDPGQIVRKKFERDKPAKGCILGLVDNTHTAVAQLFDNSIARDDLADHGANDAVPATSRLPCRKGGAVDIEETVAMGKWNVARTALLLLLGKLSESFGGSPCRLVAILPRTCKVASIALNSCREVVLLREIP